MKLTKLNYPDRTFLFFTLISEAYQNILIYFTLSTINIPFDVIGISESKQQLDKSFLVNVDIKGYSMYTQPTKSSCGGCAIYVKSQFGSSCQE